MKYLIINNVKYEIKYTKKYKGKISYYVFIDGKLKEITHNNNNIVIQENETEEAKICK